MSALALFEPLHPLTLAEVGADWPNRASSRMIEAGGLVWHVQIMGDGPTLLLAHGTGASTHSWRDLAPLLAKRYRVVAPDLPGHGFSSSRGARTQSLPGMARAVAALLDAIGLSPTIAVGHSAGAAVLARLALDGAIAPERLIALNGALAPFEGVAGYLLPTLAKALFLNPLAPRYFAWSANRAAVTRLLDGTGSKIDARGVALYARLMQNPAHVNAALSMMAHWDLRALNRDLPRLRVPFHLIVAENDKTVPPEGARKIAARLTNAHLHSVQGLGHLAHEEAPSRFAQLVFDIAESET
ncbi:alpha/beta fold hydrolase BchO [Methylocystis echinoides]|uniref:alpha/beta fold hydrolase BchO n=1 Tax=Methylocystis echinoides TaxID=29468 RepID=UPI00343D459B